MDSDSESKDRRDRSRDRPPRRDRDRSSRFSDNIRDRSNDRGGRGEPRSMKSSSNRVFVSNIPYEYRWQDMKDLFRQEVGEVQFVELFVDDNDKPKGSGIVEFADPASVKKCMDIMQRYEVKGRKLVIKEDTGNMRDKHGNLSSRRGGREDRYRDDHRDSGMRGSVDEARYGNTYGLSPQFLESLHIDCPLSNRVFVANLEYNVDKKKLKEIFRLAGRVVRVDMPLDKDGRSRGFAVVEYDHPVEAVQAISMFHNQVLYDRTMAVRIDRVNDNMKLPEGLKSIGMGLGPNGEPLKNVAHNLPSLNNPSGQVGGAGLLGAVPNNPLQLASALSGLGNVGIGNMANAQMLQAANLGLLGNGLGGDLSSLTGGQSQLGYGGASGARGAADIGGAGFGRGIGNGATPSALETAYPNLSSYGSAARGFSQSAGSGSAYGGSFGGSDRLNFQSNLGGGGDSDSKSFSRKVLVSNLPQTASFKMLHEKFREFGDIKGLDERGQGSILITYGSDWQAERAIKNLDKARIDGRMIDARLFF